MAKGGEQIKQLVASGIPQPVAEQYVQQRQFSALSGLANSLTSLGNVANTAHAASRGVRPNLVSGFSAPQASSPLGDFAAMLKIGQLGKENERERRQEQAYYGITSPGVAQGTNIPANPLAGTPNDPWKQMGITQLPQTPAGQPYPGTGLIGQAPAAMQPLLRAMDPDKGAATLASILAKEAERKANAVTTLTPDDIQKLGITAPPPGWVLQRSATGKIDVVKASDLKSPEAVAQEKEIDAAQISARQSFTEKQNDLNRKIEIMKVNATTGKQSFDRANTLRDEYNTLTKDFRTVQDAYNKIKATSDTGAGDMSLLYSYVKLLDPGSVVRESEFATAAASGSYGERIRGLVQRVVTGERLPKTLREEFKSEAERLYKGQKRGLDTTSENYRSLAERYGIKSEDVIQDYSKADTPNDKLAGPSQEDLEFTAKKHGITVDEVKRRLSGK